MPWPGYGRARSILLRSTTVLPSPRSLGEGGPFAADGRSDYGGDVVVNPRGGLMGCGHPLGATGVAQGVEAFWQLRGEAGERQVPEAHIGLTHNNSGMGEHLVMIYGRE